MRGIFSLRAKKEIANCSPLFFPFSSFQVEVKLVKLEREGWAPSPSFFPNYSCRKLEADRPLLFFDVLLPS